MQFEDLEAVKAQDGFNNVLLVDGLNLAFRYKHKKARDFAVDYLRTVNSLAQSYRASTVLIHVDKGQSTFRKGIYPEYKGNRKALREEQSEQDAEDFKLFFEDFNEAIKLAATMHSIVTFQGVEADDTIAYVATNSPRPVWIVSSDKDFDQLVNENISRFSYVTRKEVTHKNFRETYLCTPEEYITLKVLQGDTGDNVPGVPGVGIKRSLAILKEHGSALDIYDKLPLPGPQKFIKNLNEFGEQLLTNYELMDLHSYAEDAIGEENLVKLKSIMKDNDI